MKTLLLTALFVLSAYSQLYHGFNMPTDLSKDQGLLELAEFLFDDLPSMTLNIPDNEPRFEFNKKPRLRSREAQQPTAVIVHREHPFFRPMKLQVKGSKPPINGKIESIEYANKYFSHRMPKEKKSHFDRIDKETKQLMELIEKEKTKRPKKDIRRKRKNRRLPRIQPLSNEGSLKVNVHPMVSVEADSNIQISNLLKRIEERLKELIGNIKSRIPAKDDNDSKESVEKRVESKKEIRDVKLQSHSHERKKSEKKRSNRRDDESKKRKNKVVVIDQDSYFDPPFYQHQKLFDPRPSKNEQYSNDQGGMPKRPQLENGRTNEMEKDPLESAWVRLGVSLAFGALVTFGVYAIASFICFLFPKFFADDDDILARPVRYVPVPVVQGAKAASHDTTMV